MQIFFGKHTGKHIEELDSGYLLFLIESDFADWSLIQAAKLELSSRLKLDWEQPEPEIPKLQKQISKLKYDLYVMESLLTMSTYCKGNPIRLEGYMMNPTMLEMDLEVVKEINAG